MAVEMRYEERTDADNIPPLPEELEQKIKINKDAETLGVQVDIEEGGVNGMVVRSVTRGGTLARDVRGGRGDPGGRGGAAEVAVSVPCRRPWCRPSTSPPVSRQTSAASRRSA